MTVFLIRHGQSQTSGQTYAGRSDVPLTAHGHAQAQQIAAALAHEPISLILCSPLSRSRDTAQPLATRLGLDPEVSPALAEIDFGTYEGRDKASLGLHLRKTHSEVPIPGGESLRDVWTRAGHVESLLRARSMPCCAIVGHFWINRLLWGRLTGLSFETACRDRSYRPTTGSCAAVTPGPRADQRGAQPMV